jgi:hypothetical protein
MQLAIELQVVDELTPPAQQRVVLETRKTPSYRFTGHPLATSKS